MRSHALTPALIVALGIGFAVSPASAQSPADFYKKTEVSLYVGSGAGGGFDVYARTLQRHYARHIPGQPNVVVKNMPGASGLKAMNYIYNVAPKDGSAILASFNTVVMDHLYGKAGVSFDPRELSWIGSIGKQTGTCLTWHTSPVKTIEDAQKREVLVGATGADSTPNIYPKLLNAMIGTKFKVIEGYTTSSLRIAVENGEIEGLCGIAWETHMASSPSWILDKKVTFLLQLGLESSPRLPGVPLALDLIRNPEDRAVWELLVVSQEFGRPFVAPPKIPADRLKALRTAFEETLKDPQYLADAEKTKQFVDPLTGEQIETLLAHAYKSSKQVVERAKVYAVSN
ncbi:MAG TPA: tripartite tricarboxylate transporter substrate-binding protein [Alphaproteobacteria bacterium]|nr:tripartite tricarboxylate transporter substrate-binding protein [Alphaproteobacteria bacterium]